MLAWCQLWMNTDTLIILINLLFQMIRLSTSPLDCGASKFRKSPTFERRNVGMIFQGYNSCEHRRFTQHSIKALSKSAKSVMLRPPSFLQFKIAVFLIFGFLYFRGLNFVISIRLFCH